LAADLLRAEGFTDVEYVPLEQDTDQLPAVSAGDVDLTTESAAATTLAADTHPAIVHVAGIHVGSFELFEQNGIRTLTDLKGKLVAVELGAGAHVHLSVMAAYVGLDPSRDIIWVPATSEDAIAEFAAGQVDAYMAFPP